MSKNTTLVNNRSPVTKVSGGKVVTPDVCKTPVGSSIVPILYSNVAKSRNLSKGSKSVKIDGASVCLSSSEFSTSTGDEAGSAKGITGATKGRAFPINYSFNVKVEGKSVVRNGDQFTGNDRNTVPMPITQSQPSVDIDSETNPDDTQKKCPVCGAIWEKTEPTLTQVRNAVEEILGSYRVDIKAYNDNSSFGYLGSVATGKVGNPKKSHYGMEPDIRGECEQFYDIDGFIISEAARRIPKRFGKRWASLNLEASLLEKKVRGSLNECEELKYMKKGRDGFSIVFYLPNEESKLTSKGSQIIVR